MKIGILTLPYNNNYGGYLQSYALMRILKEMGHQSILLYRRHDFDVRRHKWNYIKYFIKQLLKLHIPQAYRSPEYFHRMRGANMLTFVDKYIEPKTQPIYSSSALYKEIKKHRLDAVILGSDQLWRPDYGPCIKDYFLTEISGNDIKKVSYAASFGNAAPSFTEEEKYSCGKAISEFTAVSVREKSGLDIIKRFGWKTKSTPVQVLDPTMLLTAEDYDKELQTTNKNAKGKIFCYVLDSNPSTKETINETAKELGKDIYEISDIQKGDSVLPSIEEWLTAIRDADYVITDSFHGTVFSIIFQKQFVSLVNQQRGAERFYDLLGDLKLTERCLKDICLLSSILSHNINWDLSQNILREKKKDSIEYINTSIL